MPTRNRIPLTEQVEAEHHNDNQQRFEQLEAITATLVVKQEVIAARQEAASEVMDKLVADVHTLRENMAGNTSLMQESLKGIDAIKLQIAQIAQLSQLDVPSLKEIADAMNSMKGGIRVVGWLERPVKWFAIMAGAVAAQSTQLKKDRRQHGLFAIDLCGLSSCLRGFDRPGR